ncbi:hypothetical protein K432DRAFT_389547 [Lepidopterella palustris CBS 459.81]|uniref:Polynucleotide 5'-hydroxyl-kinase GRC3 n=1 Tax=Lepidopterella palustris CBS 459.81 TaxID=1314670 RepID=A0A8E2EIW0_9PEZI|nr:hypothetical protein K432DRAFT_389547 [Lepidopterella palustris CBS 459.81]
MSGKRKAEEPLGPHLEAKSGSEHQPLSAFAAARARQSPQDDSACQATLQYNLKAPRLFSNLDSVFAQFPAEPSRRLSEPGIRTSALLSTDNAEARSDEYETDVEAAEGPGDLRPGQHRPNEYGPLCTWVPSLKNIKSSSDDHLTVSLERNETITLIGTYDFTVNKGYVVADGAVIKADGVKHRVYAPSTHAIPIIRALGEENEVQFFSCRTMRSLEKLSPLYSKIWNARIREGETGVQLSLDSKSFSVVRHAQDDPLKRPLAPLTFPGEWVSLIESIITSERPSAVMVSGPRHSGKSTFAKILLNRFLTNPRYPTAFYLDLDAGGPEYTPQGQVSLVLIQEVNLGPPFTHPAPVPTLEGRKVNQLVWAHPMPLNGAEEYNEYFYLCVINLFNRYQALLTEYPTAPLVINTPAWAYMEGLEVFLQTINRLKLTNVVYLSKNTSPGVLRTMKQYSDHSGATLHTFNPQPNPNRTRTNENLRNMHMTSYFHCDGINQGQRTYDAEPLSFMAPWQVYYGEEESKDQGFIGFLMLCDWIDPKWIKTVINGSIISIIITEDLVLQSQYRKLPRTTRMRLPYFPKGEKNYVDPPDPKTSKLVCLALLRGFEPESNLVQLLIPATHEHLVESLDPKKTVFVFGCCDHPDWSYLEDPHYDFYEEMRRRRAWKDLKPDDEDDVDEALPSEWRMGEPNVKLPPWVAKAEELRKWNGLNMPRRVRRFQG